jgi:hypothetical protein
MLMLMIQCQLERHLAEALEAKLRAEARRPRAVQSQERQQQLLVIVMKKVSVGLGV